MTRKIFAWLNLAWHFAKHVTTRLWLRPFRGGRDLARFNKKVAPEGYVPMPADAREQFVGYMHCVHCGLCAINCTTLQEKPDNAWNEAWTFVAGASRSLDRAQLVTNDMSECPHDPKTQAVCPTGVPINHMADAIRRMTVVVLLFVGFASTLHAQRVRVREAGVTIGIFQPGANNAITDVGGVRVGHTTVIEGDRIRTGVTAIVPHGGNVFNERVPAAVYIANAYGKLAGSTQVQELGELETPILLTCTLCVWKAADAMVEWLLTQPNMQSVRSINPVVGETNDGGLNDIRSRPINAQHVRAALESAKSGPVEEGAVGAGTGTIAFGWKGGIGTSSRIVPKSLGGYTVGVLVQTNFGGVLSINGAPVGRELGQYAFKRDTERGDGSCMIVVATDAPIDARNLERLAKRAIVGLARTGSSMSNGSGDFVIAFSTADSVRRRQGNAERTIVDLPNEPMSGLFQAVAEATEEAIYNSMFMASTTSGNGMTVEALPLDKVLPILKKYGVVK
ncbi:MAG TPA: P1 family peptidase [Longimicrobiales bacterium]|nr:P1 family peptidase [Longimicrobiales bacterium]